MTFPQALWLAAGSPVVQGVTITPDPCAVCGGDCERRAVPAKKAFGSNFSAHDQLAAPWSGHVCRACVWVMHGRPPDTLRMWTVLYREDGGWVHGRPEKAPELGETVYTTNKADMREVLRLLADPPACRWGMAVAVSGQIHVAPFAPLCAGSRGCGAQVERERMEWSPADAVVLRDAVRELVEAGVPKVDIEAAQTTAQTLRRVGVDVWRDHEPLLTHWSRSVLLRTIVMATRKGVE